MLSGILGVFCVILAATLWHARKRLIEQGRRTPAPRPAQLGNPETLRIDALMRRLLALHEYGASRTGNVSIDEFCTLFLENVCEWSGVHRASLMLADDESGALTTTAIRDLPRSLRSLTLKSGEGLPGQAVRLAGPAFAEPKPLVPESPEPLLCVPLLLKGKALGVLNLHELPPGLVSDETALQCLCLLSAEAAVVLHHQRRYDTLESFYLEMVQTLANAVDARDAYAQGRVEDSRAWARELARELGLSEQQVRYVEFSTMLQGVGKIGIDQSILSKPGKLTPEEFEQIKKHTTIGYRMLAPVKFLGPVAQMVLYHQEWFNGRGYPEGLKGDAIPLGSRIVAVITAWEAMNSDRPYRKRLPRETALAELKKGEGTQFDPKVVEAFLQVEARRHLAAQSPR
ncbi:MAG: HD domain-containing phosphohydrolase [Elusimicrobiota bacterium]|jgi:hypothetical protein